MKKILYVSLLSMVLFIGGCGKPSFQELQETYPKCTTTLTSILLSQKQCTAEKLLDETFDCGE
ncbi:MAG: hypothetical protein LBU27_04895 [Candidatus Peribacteria bacterium]|jgi:hypothetical protein|nr:hypothetical protein [Candidatus Peribacteria bacterium]